ncbi:hypothetical protein [Actinokineospora globicatena]|uniref:hypothetical protein n=1 Tax=Actinokineospora globicatena TaxID=103729 RepID=UPI0020A2B8A2|nr:hypothetical protein [Actinokineospora globicatena]MCP2301197.1 hypothetical protein [Actinokineospora globicatena]GLW77167.1 hypothetical protein Aglo01_16490 [Actinokineospora globicatena]GLW84001.1 hypothetical protein Aglo02_16410 [Actinokineospora globicatena]
MTWQEELRQLDADLAAGRLSSDDYRVRRDAVLAKAASGDTGLPLQPAPTPAPAPPVAEPITQLPLPPAPTPTPPAAEPISTPVPVPPQPTTQDKPADGPFPPAFKWKDDTPAVEATNIIPAITADTPRPPGIPVGERTQTVQTVRPAEAQADRTQVVRNPEQQAQQAQPQADRTQVVSSSEMRTVTTNFPPQPQVPQQPQHPVVPPGWNQPQRPVESAPPWWVGEEVPDLGNSSWPQNSDVFATDTKPGRGRTVLLVIVAIIIVLGIATGAFFFGKSVGESKSSSHPALSQQSAVEHR